MCLVNNGVSMSVLPLRIDVFYVQAVSVCCLSSCSLGMKRFSSFTSLGSRAGRGDSPPYDELGRARPVGNCC